MSATSSSVPSSSFSPTTPFGLGNPVQASGPRTTLYLIAFFVTASVLALIVGGFVFRAYIVRRRFEERIEEAIRNGQVPPLDAAIALGLIRRVPKGEKPIGETPVLWETEMLREKDGGQSSYAQGGDDWRDINPLGVLYFLPGPDATPTSPFIDISRFRRSAPRGELIRSYFRLGVMSAPDDPTPTRPSHDGKDVDDPPESTPPPKGIPPDGTVGVLGVLIALPSEAGTDGDKWKRKLDDEDEEEGHEVPDVCLGVMSVTIGNGECQGS